MNILIAHNEYGKFSGEEHAVQTMAAVLTKQGHHVSWLKESSSVIGESLKEKVRAFFSGIYSTSARKKMDALLQAGTIDVVQVQNLYPFLSPSILLSCKQNGIPVVMRCPNYRLFCPTGLHLYQGKICEDCLGGLREWSCVRKNCEHSFFKSLGYAVRNAAARLTGMITDNVDVFIVLSQFQKERFIAGGIPEEKLKILPNIAPSMSVESAFERGDLITYVGRVSEEKGIGVFLKAAEKMVNNKFYVVGSISSMPDIEKHASPNVVFTGFLESEQLDEIFDSSRALVFPSLWYEGFPNVIAKAMAHRKPVVASRLGAVVEIVDDGKTGFLVDPGNVEDMVEKLTLLSENRELSTEMGQAGYLKAVTKYSADRYYEILEEIYHYALMRHDEVGRES